MNYYLIPGVTMNKNQKIALIIDETLQKYGLKKADVFTPNRGTVKAAEARMLISSRLRWEIGLSTTKVGSIMGRHYSTVIYACKTIDLLTRTNQLLVQ